LSIRSACSIFLLAPSWVGSYCRTLRIGQPFVVAGAATGLVNGQPSGAVHCAVGFVVIKSIR
jgi:hypothetical protein